MKYDANNALLRRLLPKEVFEECIKTLNSVMRAFWPCPLVWYFGYICALPTLGLSFLAPNLCVRDGVQSLYKAVERQNRIKLREMGLEIKLVFGLSTSWLEIRTYHPNESSRATKAD